MDKNLRGREPGEVPALMEIELRRLGGAPDAILHAASELAAVREALEQSRMDYRVLLTIHSERDAVLGLVSALEVRGWAPGEALD